MRTSCISARQSGYTSGPPGFQGRPPGVATTLFT